MVIGTKLAPKRTLVQNGGANIHFGNQSNQIVFFIYFYFLLVTYRYVLEQTAEGLVVKQLS